MGVTGIAAAEERPFEGVTVTLVVHSGHHALPWHKEADTIEKLYGIKLIVVETPPGEIYSSVSLLKNQA